MCYSEFNDIIDSIVHMDADVISIECSRSRMELLDAFDRVRYPDEIGPGVYRLSSEDPVLQGGAVESGYTMLYFLCGNDNQVLATGTPSLCSTQGPARPGSPVK
jgi:hypothetical protein